MGRPPVGKTAMTAAERMRRWRARYAAEHAANKHEPSASRATRAAKEPAPPPSASTEELAQAKKRIVELQKELAKVEKDRDKWKAGYETSEMHKAIVDHINDSERWLGQARLVLPRAWKPMVRLMRGGLHPDRMRGDDKWLKRFDAIKVTFVDQPK